MKDRNVLLGCLCALGCECLYGLSYIFTKSATESASGYALLGWRFLIAAVVICILVLFGVVKLDLKNKSKKPLIIVALFSPCLYFLCETIGISNTTASESGVLLACIPVASLVASSLILKKKPSKLQITGVLITLIGVVVTVVAVGANSSLSFLGYTFLVMGVISYALYTVFVDKASDYSGAEITFVMLICGAVLYIVMALIDGLAHGEMYELVMLPFTNRSFLAAILFQGIGCSVIAFFLSNVAISKIGVNRTASFIGVATVVSIFAGAIFLHESFSMYQVIGAIIIIAGVYIANAKVKESSV